MERYHEAKKLLAESRARFAEMFKSTPVILRPPPRARAPRLIHHGRSANERALDGSGNSSHNVPMPVASGLPLGLQLTADLGQDSRILPAALLLYQRLTASPKTSI